MAAARQRVVIVGGGVIGTAVALELAEGYDVVLVDPAPGRGAAWAAAGMLSPAAEAAPGEEALLDQLSAASALWPTFAERLRATSGLDVAYERAGAILVGLTPSDAREVARLAQVIRGAGHELAPVGVDALEELEPALAGGPRGAWRLDGDARVDNRLLVEALLAACKAAGVGIVEDAVTHVDLGTGLTCRLEHQGDVASDRLVVATGAARAPSGLEGLGLAMVRPVRGITLRCRAARGEALPCRTIRAVVDGQHCYLVPRRSRALVVGATTEEQGHALDARAGGVHQLLDAARRVLPGVDELVLEEVAVGLRPATEDHLPFVGRLADPRVVAALGHYRNGVLLAPLAARQVAEALRA